MFRITSQIILLLTVSLFSIQIFAAGPAFYGDINNSTGTVYHIKNSDCSYQSLLWVTLYSGGTSEGTSCCSEADCNLGSFTQVKYQSPNTGNAASGTYILTNDKTSAVVTIKGGDKHSGR